MILQRNLFLKYASKKAYSRKKIQDELTFIFNETSERRYIKAIYVTRAIKKKKETLKLYPAVPLQSYDEIGLTFLTTPEVKIVE